MLNSVWDCVIFGLGFGMLNELNGLLLWFIIDVWVWCSFLEKMLFREFEEVWVVVCGGLEVLYFFNKLLGKEFWLDSGLDFEVLNFFNRLLKLLLDELIFVGGFLKMLL